MSNLETCNENIKLSSNELTSEENQEEKDVITHPDIDGGWGWIVFIMAYITRLLMGGMFWAINSYFVVFHEEFGETRSFTAAIGSVTFATFHATAPISSLMIQRFGIRISTIVGALLTALNYLLNSYATGVLYLIFTHGILLGVGFSLISNSSLVSLNEYFRRYANLVTGISMSGTGIGMFIFARLIPHLLDTYGWRGSMYLLSGCALQLCVCGSVLFPIKPQSQVFVTKRSYSFGCEQVKEFLTSSVFWWLNISYFFYAVSAVTIMVLYKDIALMYQMGHVFAWSLTVFGAGDIIGRAITGLVTSCRRIHPTLFYSAVNIFCALIAILHIFLITGSTSFLILGFLLGAAIGSQITLLSIVALAMFGRKKFVVAIGYVQCTAGVGALVGPPIAGFLTDATDSYSLALGFVAVMGVMAAIAAYGSYYLHNKRMTSKPNEKDAENNKIALKPVRTQPTFFVSNKKINGEESLALNT